MIRHFVGRRLEAKPLGLIPQIFESNGILFFFDSLPIFQQKVFRLFTIDTLHTFGNLVYLWVECEAIKLVLVSIRACSLESRFLFVGAFNTSFVEKMAIIHIVLVSSGC